VVVTGSSNGMVSMQMADSGELIGKWRGLPDEVQYVAMDMACRKVMG
jgi:hypothetical protein